MVACWLFRIAGIARILHTVVYGIYPLPQPIGGILYFIPFGITIWMAIWGLLVFLS